MEPTIDIMFYAFMLGLFFELGRLFLKTLWKEMFG